MNILITGGAGFIGSHLAELLISQGDSVVVVDDLSTGSLDNISHLKGEANFTFIRSDVRDSQLMSGLIKDCDQIYHLAAAVGVQLIVDQPVHTLQTNIAGSEVVLDLASKFGRKTFVASTSEVYGKSDKIPFKEEDDVVLGSTRFTRWSYACSKMVDEFLALAYYNQYELPVVICRFFNTVGPRQSGQYGMVVPRFVRKALTGEPIEIYGTGKQSRCFCNVADVTGAIVKLMSCPDACGQVINLGADVSISMEDLADKIIEMTGSASVKRQLSYEEAYGQAFDDMMTRVPDLSKVKAMIGFEPKYTLEQTLQQIIDFEKKRI